MKGTPPPPLKTWWGQRWAEAFQVAVPEPKPRGRQRPRAARLRSLDATTGEASLEISTSSVLPYEVRIAVPPIPDDVWEKATAALAGRAFFAAKMLAGDLPPEAEEAFVAAGASLFPNAKEVRTRCNCPAGTGGCRHGQLAQRALAEAIDRDPFLLFDLRGRPRAQVLAALGLSLPAPATEPGTVTAPVPVPVAAAAVTSTVTETVSETGAATAPATEPVTAPAKEPDVAVPDDPATFRRPRGDLSALRFHIAPPEHERLLLTRLGDPPGWRGPPSFLEALGIPVAAAAAKARSIAMGDEPEKPDAGGTGHR